MKKLALAVAAATMVAFAGGAMAQSAKFDASWDNDVKFVKAAVVFPGAATCDGSPGKSGSGTELLPCILAEETIATLDVAQQKDLLIGVSAQIGLVTLTVAKGKGGTGGTPQVGEALASAGVDVTLELREADADNPGSGALAQIAAPGKVTFAARLQELKVAVTDDTSNLTTVTVSLLLDTTTAHHFNFIGVDLDQGMYDVVAVFDLSAFVDAVGEDAIAEAEVILGPRIVTAQEVRAAQGSLDAVTQCNDNIDNDSDGDIDYPDDAECTRDTDDDERP